MGVFTISEVNRIKLACDWFRSIEDAGSYRTQRAIWDGAKEIVRKIEDSPHIAELQEKPHLVSLLARAYYDAGSDLIKTGNKISGLKFNATDKPRSNATFEEVVSGAQLITAGWYSLTKSVQPSIRAQFVGSSFFELDRADSEFDQQSNDEVIDQPAGQGRLTEEAASDLDVGFGILAPKSVDEPKPESGPNIDRPSSQIKLALAAVNNRKAEFRDFELVRECARAQLILEAIPLSISGSVSIDSIPQHEAFRKLLGDAAQKLKSATVSDARKYANHIIETYYLELARRGHEEAWARSEAAAFATEIRKGLNAVDD